MYRFFVISITSVIVLLVGATGISAASQRALPGDSLYSVKTSLEDAQISVATDAEAKAELSMKFAESRLSEIQTLVEAQRYEDIAVASSNLEDRLTQAAEQVQEVALTDPAAGTALDNELDALVARHAKVMGALLLAVPQADQPVVQTTINSLTNDNDDNGNVNDNDDNGNDNDDNGNVNDNDDNGNDNDDNGNVNDNDDNGNDNDNDNDNDDNGNVNDNDDNGNDNDDNGNVNDNDDNGNDNDDNGNVNDNDDNGNDNDDNGNDNDDNGNVNDNDDDDNDDNGNDNDDDGNDNDDDDDDDNNDD